MNTNKFISIFSSFFMILAIIGFAYLATQIIMKAPDEKVINDKYKTVEIESIKNDALNMLSERQNVSGIPLTVPLQKMGKSNPFAGINQ
ncbi:MAG: hypothetical protein WCO23_01930 [bacterium]